MKNRSQFGDMIVQKNDVNGCTQRYSVVCIGEAILVKSIWYSCVQTEASKEYALTLLGYALLLCSDMATIAACVIVCGLMSYYFTFM